MSVRTAPAPIVVFAYKRPEHLARAIESLKRNPEASQSALYVYCDAAKGPQDIPAVDAVRACAARIDGFATLHVVQRERNFGLSASVIDGVSRVLEEHGRAIVVEDDLLLSPHFLRYMNEGLTLYAEEASVASIHGYCYPVRDPLPETFFLRGADCWGWATWRRAWRHFEPDGRRLLTQLREQRLTGEFDLDGAYPYTRMLQDQIDGLNDSWAVRWHASCFLRGALTLYPGRSLVHNDGNDGSGTHAGSARALDQQLARQPVTVERIPLRECPGARAAFARFYRAQGALRLRRWAGALARRVGRLLR